MGKRIRNFLAKNRRRKWVSKLDRILVNLHKGYENLDYDLATNGEAAVIRKLQATRRFDTIFDVGANRGSWSEIASEVFPQAKIYSFEIVPKTYLELLANCGGRENVILQNLGLSDKAGAVTVFYRADKSKQATCVANFVENHRNHPFEKIEAWVSTGDGFCSERGIEGIDFLKIDVEGFEARVLKGFEGMLGEGRIKIIQFEYGIINIEARHLLKDFYDFLTPFGMKIGKIYPSFVDFREYRYSDENFLGPNYLAVHASCEDVLKALGDM